MFEITITKTGTVTEDAGGKWDIVEDYVDEDSGKVLQKRGYTPQIEVDRTKKFEIYRQQIEDGDFDLVTAIAAFNGLQVPPKVTGR